MNKLAQYLSENKSVRQKDLAEKAGTTQATISRLASGVQSPALDLAEDIERATSGAVKVADWPSFKRIADALSQDAAE